MNNRLRNKKKAHKWFDNLIKNDYKQMIKDSKAYINNKIFYGY